MRSPVRARSGARMGRCAGDAAQSPVRPELTELVAEAVAASGHPVVRLASGAGHDAVMLARRSPPVAMLFVRCAGGVSHNPAESVTAEDVAARDRRDDEVPRARRMSFDVIDSRRDRGRRRRSAELDVGVADGRDRGASVRSWRDPRREEIDARRAASSCPAWSTRTSTSTSPAAPTGRASPPARAALAAGGATTSSTCRSTPTRRRSTPPRSTPSARCLRAQRARRLRALGRPRPGRASSALDELAARGVVGFKAFMCRSGIDDFPARRRPHALRGDAPRGARSACRSPCTRRARRSPPASRARARRGAHRHARLPRARGRSSPSSRRSRARSRSPRRPAARCTSSTSRRGRGVALVAEARARGVDVDLRDLPALPGARPRTTPSALGARRQVRAAAAPGAPSARRCGRALADGTLPMVASDHSPAPPATEARATRSPPGAASPAARRLLALLLSDGPRRGARARADRALAAVPAPRASAWPARAASSPAPTPTSRSSTRRRHDARAEDLLYRHRHSPFVGRTLRARVVRTLVRGRPCRRRPDRRSARGRLLIPDVKGAQRDDAGDHGRAVRVHAPAWRRSARRKTCAAFIAAAAVRAEGHPRALERRVDLDPARRLRSRRRASRTTRATPRPARSSSTPAASARPRSCCPTAAACSRASSASSPATTS